MGRGLALLKSFLNVHTYISTFLRFFFLMNYYKMLRIVPVL